MAGLLAYLLMKHPEALTERGLTDQGFRKALEFANRCAAHAATLQGAIPSLPKSEEVAWD
jgi:sugar/nucleoside kinase (ribokinase family)